MHVPSKRVPELVANEEGGGSHTCIYGQEADGQSKKPGLRQFMYRVRMNGPSMRDGDRMQPARHVTGITAKMRTIQKIYIAKESDALEGPPSEAIAPTFSTLQKGNWETDRPDSIASG